MKTQKAIRLSGVTHLEDSIVPKGTEVMEWNVDGKTNRCRLVTGQVVRVDSAFNVPSVASLEKWSEGIAKAVDGAQVEPDGYSPDGAPSWLLVCGLI